MIYPLLAELEAARHVYNFFSFNLELAVLMSGIIASFLVALTYFSPIILPVSAFLRGRIKIPRNAILGVFCFFLFLHWIGFQTASWLLTLTSPTLVLLTITLTLQALINGLRLAHQKLAPK
jgi:hypothetical protein